MAYEPHVWVTDEIITAERLNEIEDELGRLSTLTDGLDNDDSGTEGQINSISARLTNLESSKADKTQVTTLETNIRNTFAEKSTVNELSSRVSESATTIGGHTTTLAAHAVSIGNLETNVDDVSSYLEYTNSIKTAKGSVATRLDTLESNIGASGEGSLGSRVSALEEITEGYSGSGAIATAINSKANSSDLNNKADKTVVDELVNTVGDSSSGLVKEVNDLSTKIDNVPTQDSVTALTNRVSTLEDKNTIVISVSDFEALSVSDSSTKKDADYIVGPYTQENGIYKYWRIINNVKTLISGGGTTNGGTSSAEFYSTLTDISSPDVNIDYYVGNNTDGYVHYRYILPEGASQGQFIYILPKNLVTDLSVNNNGGLIAHTVDDSTINTLSNFIALKSVDVTDNLDPNDTTKILSQTLTIVDTNGQTHQFTLQGGGSGGGSSYSVRLENNSATNVTLPSGSNNVINLPVKLIVKQGGADINLSGAGTITVQYKNTNSSTWLNASTINNVDTNTVINVPVTNLLEDDTTTDILITASIKPEDIVISRSLTYHITKTPIYIESINYDQSVVRTGSALSFSYRCIGVDLQKTVNFLVDDTLTTVDVGESHNRQLTQSIPLTGLSSGSHSFKVWFTTNGINSNILNYYILYNDGTASQAPIIGAAAQSPTITDGDELVINYTVSTTGKETTDRVTMTAYTDDISAPYATNTATNVTNNIVNTYTILNYPSSGTLNIVLSATNIVDGTEYTFTTTTTVNILEYQTDYELEYSGVDNLIYDYSARGRTNNDATRANYEYVYTDNTSSPVKTLTFHGVSTGFNWATNGYIGDDALTISGGAVHTVDVPIFTSSYEGVNLESNSGTTNILTHGRTIEIDYEVVSAANLSEPIMTCADELNTGFKITPQACYLVKQGSQVVIDESGLIHDEDAIAAAYLSTNMRTHLTFVIEPASNVETRNHEYHQCVNIYVNGEFANSCPYDKTNDTFSTTATLSIGNNNCIIKLYGIKMYNRGLEHTEVLNNYMMSAHTKREQVINFEDNDVLNSQNLVDYEKARKKFNCLLLTGEISPYKKSTKTPCGATLTKPSATEQEGYHVEFDLLDNTGETYTGDDGKTYLKYYSSNNVQGTSSQTYPIHNLKVYLAKEETSTTTDEETGEPVTTVESKKVKYSLRGANGIGESTLCWKADYMSTDHANTYNANLANGLFNDLLPSQVQDSKVQNTVYGIRCLLFNRETPTSTPVFIADGCLNNDKGNNKTFGLEVSGDSGNDTLRQKWEFTNNSSPLCFFKNDGLFAEVTSSGSTETHLSATDAFESTYPDEGDLEKAGLIPNYNHFQVLLTWVYQRANYWDASDTVTGETYSYNGVDYDNEKDYRKAIFRNEFQRHFNLNHVLTYHLFSEFIALCDNRAKNMFIRCDDVRAEEVKKLNGDTIFSGNNNPNASFFKDVVQDGTNYKFAHADEIDWGENSTFAVWAPVLYDLDSCYGVENVGKITIAYDADWNYTYKNKSQFSGVDSRFWLMVEDTFGTELTTLAKELYPRNNGLNYQTIYTEQIEANQDSTCPALINQDMLLKFNQFWADGFIDYSLAGNPHVYRDYKYIQRGTRTTQKDAFMRKRANYLSSKYSTTNFMQDQIRFRSSVVVPAANSGITLTTNQTLYPCITYGDNKPAIRSVNKISANQSVTLMADGEVGNTDTLHIGGASALTDIGDISKFQPYDMDVAGGTNLKKLIIGNHNIINTNTNKIDNISACALLEELNIENCTVLSNLSLANNGLIKKVNAYGCSISPILPNGGVLEELYLGELAPTIQILNQSNFRIFDYQNSNTNHYENVTRVWIENTPNVPIIDIVTNAWNHLNNGLRLVGINVDLNTYDEGEVTGQDITFLEYLVSDNAKGKYLTADGSYVAGNTNYPYISGDVTVESIRQTMLDKLNELYPYLEIHTNTIIQDHQIIYQDWDGRELLRLAASEGEIIPDPVTELDIYGNPYLTEPVRAADVAATYTFGRHSNANAYIEYSGWKRLQQDGSYVTNNWIMPDSNVILVAVYSSTPMQYSMRWVTEDGTLIKIRTGIDYGTNLATSGISHPRIGEVGLELTNFYKYQNSNGKYKLLTGWDTPLTGILTGDMTITGTYEENTHTFTTTSTLNSLTELNAADLYALGEASTTIKNRLLPNLFNNTYHTVTMGNDIEYSSVESTDLIRDLSAVGQTLTLTGASNGYKTLSGFAPLTNNEAFTIAFDVKPLMDANIWGNQEYVLASCYKTTNSAIAGFRLSLYNDGTIRVYWGDQYVVVDNYAILRNNGNFTGISSYRTMVVIAHDANSSDLRVYYGIPNTDVNIIQSGVTGTTLTFNASIINDNPIILGGALNASGNISNTSVMRPGACTFYWIKYWNAALSADDCLNLAAWPHKEVSFALIGYNNGQEATTSSTTQIIHDDDVKISLAAMEPISDRLYSTANLFQNSATQFSWATSNLKTFCQDRIFKAMPLKYQALLKATNFSVYQRTVNNNNITYSIVNDTNNYVYLPSYAEIVNSNTYQNMNQNYGQEATHPWPWMDISNVPTIYTLDASNRLVVSTGNELDIRPLRYRFLDNVVTTSSRIFYFDNNPYRITTYEISGGGTTSVQYGDIWYKSSGAVYIFVSAEQIENGALVDSDYLCYDSNNNIIGGWLAGIPWLTRSYNTQLSATSSGNARAFVTVSALGGADLSTTITNAALAYALCPEISI